MVRSCAGLAVVLALLAPGVAAAGDRYVTKTGSDADPCAPLKPCLTVAHATSVAASGDTVHVGPGLYTEAVDAAGKQLAFRGVGPGTLKTFSTGSNTAIASS